MYTQEQLTNDRRLATLASRIVSEYYNIPIGKFRRKQVDRFFVDYKHIVQWMLAQSTPMSVPRISMAMWDNSEKAATNGISKIQQKSKVNKFFKEDLDILIHNFNNIPNEEKNIYR